MKVSSMSLSECQSLDISESVEASKDSVQLGVLEETAGVLLEHLCQFLNVFNVQIWQKGWTIVSKEVHDCVLTKKSIWIFISIS